MPSGYLHYRCARDAAATANLRIPQQIAFSLGTQGPDPLFTLGIFPLRLSSKSKPYGKMLHTTRTGRFLTALCTLAHDRGPICQAYAMGFLTHYALDATVHPYVYAHSVDPKGGYSSPLHMRLEKHWDALYYWRDGLKGTPVAMPGVIEAKAHWPVIASLWADAIAAVYPVHVAKEEILEALESTASANRLTHSAHGIKYGLMFFIERVILRKPYMITAQMTPRRPMRGDIENTSHRPWHPPAEPSRTRQEGLGELLATATARASELLVAASAYFDGGLTADALGEIIGDAGYDTGLSSLP